MRWSSHFQTEFLVLRPTLRPPEISSFRIRDYHPLWFTLPSVILLWWNFVTLYGGLGCSPFNRLYLGNRYCFLFLWVLRCFNSPGLPRMAMYSPYDNSSSCYWVPPFGHLRIFAYLLLPVAFRCSSRPSSPSSAKASSVRSFFLNLTNFI